MTPTNRDLDYIDLRIHNIIGAWAIERRVLMPPSALDAVETALRDLLLAYGAEQRERCAQLCGEWDEGVGTHTHIAAAIRALT